MLPCLTSTIFDRPPPAAGPAEKQIEVGTCLVHVWMNARLKSGTHTASKTICRRSWRRPFGRWRTVDIGVSISRLRLTIARIFATVLCVISSCQRFETWFDMRHTGNQSQPCAYLVLLLAS
jgi:hypothetical protein